MRPRAQRGDTVKLPEHLARPAVPPVAGNGGRGTAVKVAGMVKTCRIEAIGSQALREPARAPMGAVHRLNVGGSALAWSGAGLRYSRFPPRGGLWEERGAIASRESPQVLR